MTDSSSELPQDDVLGTPGAAGKAIRGGVIRATGYGIGLVLSLVSVPLLTRHLGVADFGGYVTVVSLTMIVGLVADAGLTVIGVREYSVRASDSRRPLIANILSLRLAIAGAGVVVATLFAVAAGYDDSLVLGTVLAGISVVLLGVQQTWAIPITADLRMGLLTALDLLRKALVTGLILAAIAAGAGVTILLAVPIPAGVAVAAGTAMAIHRRAPLRAAIESAQWRYLIREALPVAAASILAALFYRIAVIMMSVLSTKEETGYFSASLRVVEVIVPIPSLITSTAFPILARAAVDAGDRLAYGMQRLFEICLILGVWTALALILGAEPIISFIGGSDFRPAVDVLQLQGIATAASFLFAVWAAGLWALGAQRALLVATVVGVGSVLVLTGLLAPSHGATGAALSMTVSETLLAATAGFLLMRGHPKMRVSLRIVPKVGAAVAVAALLSMADLPPTVLVCLATLVYFGILVILRAIPPDIRRAFLGRGAGTPGDGQ